MAAQSGCFEMGGGEGGGGGGGAGGGAGGRSEFLEKTKAAREERQVKRGPLSFISGSKYGNFFSCFPLSHHEKKIFRRKRPVEKLLWWFNVLFVVGWPGSE